MFSFFVFCCCCFFHVYSACKMYFMPFPCRLVLWPPVAPTCCVVSFFFFFRAAAAAATLHTAAAAALLFFFSPFFFALVFHSFSHLASRNTERKTWRWLARTGWCWSATWPWSWRTWWTPRCTPCWWVEAAISTQTYSPRWKTISQLETNRIESMLFVYLFQFFFV